MVEGTLHTEEMKTVSSAVFHVVDKRGNASAVRIQYRQRPHVNNRPEVVLRTSEEGRRLF